MGTEQAQIDEEVAAVRRRAVLLAGATAVPALLVVSGASAAWPLFSLALVLALPLGGSTGMLAVLASSGLVSALATGRPGVDGAAIAVGLAAFAGTGVVVGTAHRTPRHDTLRAQGLSLTDRLTGLSNYASFADSLPRECRRSDRYEQTLSLVLLDLDDFKGFNDRHGHEAGNRLLASVGAAIRQGVRRSDLACRFGGDEFALIVPGPLEEAAAVAARVRIAIDELRIPVGEGWGRTTISAGIAAHERAADPDGAELLARADRALYRAKSSGRDRSVVEEPSASSGERLAAAS